MEIFLAKVKVVHPNGTLDVESFESNEIAINIDIMTQGWQFWKPIPGDLVVIAKTKQNQQFCLGTLHPNHQDWQFLFGDTDHTNLLVVNEGHWVSDNNIIVSGTPLP